MYQTMKLFWICLIFFGSSAAALAQEISVYPGFWGLKYFKGGERISKKIVANELKSVPSAYINWEKSNDQHLGAMVACGAMLGLGIITLQNAFEMKDEKVYAYGTIGFGILSIVLELSSISARKKAILNYNKHVTKGQSNQRSLSLEPTNNGIGFFMKF